MITPLVYIISSTMASLESILPPIDPPPPKRHKCAICKQVVHTNRRTCTAAPAEWAIGAIANTTRNRNRVVATPSTDPYAVTPVANSSFYINWDHVLNVVFDLETTGRSRSKSEIVELACLNHFGPKWRTHRRCYLPLSCCTPKESHPTIHHQHQPHHKQYSGV